MTARGVRSSEGFWHPSGQPFEEKLDFAEAGELDDPRLSRPVAGVSPAIVNGARQVNRQPADRQGAGDTAAIVGKRRGIPHGARTTLKPIMVQQRIAVAAGNEFHAAAFGPDILQRDPEMQSLQACGLAGRAEAVERGILVPRCFRDIARGFDDGMIERSRNVSAQRPRIGFAPPEQPRFQKPWFKRCRVPDLELVDAVGAILCRQAVDRSHFAIKSVIAALRRSRLKIHT